MFSPVKSPRLSIYWGFQWLDVSVFHARLQREEEAAYAISHGAQTQAQAQATAMPTHPALPSLGPFSKFEEKKTNEKTRKVTTVKKFFSTSSSRTPKKGTKLSVVCCLGRPGSRRVHGKNQDSLFLCAPCTTVIFNPPLVRCAVRNYPTALVKLTFNDYYLQIFCHCRVSVLWYIMTCCILSVQSVTSWLVGCRKIFPVYETANRGSEKVEKHGCTNVTWHSSDGQARLKQIEVQTQADRK